MGSETTPEMLAMARRIGEEIADTVPASSMNDEAIGELCERAALAAIKETTELAAITCEQRGHVTSADALRNGEHYHDR